MIAVPAASASHHLSHGTIEPGIRPASALPLATLLARRLPAIATAELITAITVMIAMLLAISDDVSKALRPDAHRLISHAPAAAAAVVATATDAASGSEAIVMP